MAHVLDALVQCGEDATEFFMPVKAGHGRCYCAGHERDLDDLRFAGWRRSSFEEFLVAEVLES